MCSPLINDLARFMAAIHARADGQGEWNSFAVSVANRDGGQCVGVYAVPGDSHFRVVLDRDGIELRRQSYAQAEADAGQALASLLNKTLRPIGEAA